MKKSTIFVKAHKLAKAINNKVKNYTIAFSIALKQIWKLVKEGRKRIPQSTINYTAYDLTHKPYNGPIYRDGVPDWLLCKNLDKQEKMAVWNYTDSSHIERETAKAVLVTYKTVFGEVSVWCPKSVFKGLAFNN